MAKNPVYILPGTMCNHRMFEAQIIVLQNAGYTPHVIPFTEQTTIAQMAELTKTIALESAPFIGFSMGGIVALALLKSNPELIKSLCLISSNSLADKPERPLIRQKQIKQAQATSTTDVLKHDFMPHYFHQPNLEHNKLVLKMANELGFNAFSAQLNALSTREDTLNVIEKTNKKLLFVGGEHDVLCPSTIQKTMHNACPNSDLILLGNCGHFVPLERSNTLNALLVDWLESIK
ncbi:MULTISPECIES: alpha/beta fold hydrolase [Pseudoalteromonas]|uniref:alpha/beta fold hydrolase n=1 Tax=Pseudoalteromonas TaxID=53246 RepID=UPI0013FD6AA7|nr:alpha/beta hydrolase [Pseudoalteromonas distincta]